jgi:DNA-binding NarL/FixJ family response regulator
MGAGRTAVEETQVTADGPLNIVLVDPHRTSRKGTELLLRSWGHHVVGAADDASSGHELIRKRRPHVALVDLDLPGGTEPVLRAPKDFGSSVVLFLEQPDRHELDEALECGARGLVLKSGDPGELRQAVRAAGNGRRYVAPAVEALLVRQRLNLNSALSKREREVLQLLAHGMTGEQASQHLVLSPETVRTHIRNAMRRLGARTRVQAVTMAVARREIRL